MTGPVLAIALGDTALEQQVARWLADEGLAYRIRASRDAPGPGMPLASALGELTDADTLRRSPPAGPAAGAGPLIVLGGAASWPDRLLAAERGAAGFVGLPLVREALLAAVRALLDERLAPPADVLLFGPAGDGAQCIAAALRQRAMQVHVEGDPSRLFDRLGTLRPDVMVLLPGLRHAPVSQTLRMIRSDRAWDDLMLLAVVPDAAAAAELPAGTSVLIEPVVPAALAGAVADRARRRRSLNSLAPLHPLLAMQDQERRALDAHALVSITDAGGSIVYANDHFCATSGYRRDELLGRNHRIVKSGHHPPEVYAGLWRTIARGEIWQGELCNRRKDGSLYWVATTIMPMGDGPGVRRYLSIRTDITAAKQVQRSLRRRVRQQRALAALSRRLMTCDRPQLLAQVPQVLRLSARLLGAAQAQWMSAQPSRAAADAVVRWPPQSAGETADASMVQPDAPPSLRVRVGEKPDDFGHLAWWIVQPSPAWRANDRIFTRALAGLLAGAWSRSGAQLAQRASELALQDMLRAFPGIVAATSDGGTFDYANESFAQLFGREAAQVVGLPVHELLPATTAASVQRLRRRVVDEGRPVFFEHEIPTAGADEPRHFAVVHFASGGHEGVPRRFFLIGVDITERRRMEQRLQHLMVQAQAEGGLQALIAAAATDLGAATPSTLDGVIHDVLREAGRHFEVDRAYLALVSPPAGPAAPPHEWCAQGVATRGESLARAAGALPSCCPYCDAERGEPLHVPDVDAMPPELAQEQALLRALGVKAALSVPVRVQGSVIGGLGFDAVRAPLRWSDGAIRALDLLGQILGNAVHRARSELTLRALKEEAEAASAAKSEFLASMSHELRTPMNAVLGFGQLLELTLDVESRERGYVQEILRGGRHLLSLIDEVLDLARIESGRVDLSLEPIALADLVAESLRLMRPLADRRGIVVEVEVGPCLLLADRVRLKQVLVNLVSNAIKYNVDGGRVDIRTRPAAPGHLRVEVRDSGPGIAPERHRELFQPFNRLGAEAGPVEGTGIGLVLVRRLVELMGGRVGVDSAPGRGSTFWFDLPVPDIEAMQALPAAVDSSFADLHGVTGKRVLYVDDNPSNLRLMESILAHWPGVQLLTAQHPQLGLELAEVHRPDLVLLDIQMAPLDGFEVLRRIRRHPELAAVPVAAITANAMPRDLQRVRDAGFDECLTKPFEMRKLMAILEKHLRPPAGDRRTVP